MKMLTKEGKQRQAVEMLCTDRLAPKDHLPREIDAAVDFGHIYELAGPGDVHDGTAFDELYSRVTSRKSRLCAMLPTAGLAGRQTGSG